jgi:chromosome segregation ATPase
MPKPEQQQKTPVDELIARFQLESERAIAGVRADTQRLVGDLATKVAQLQDRVTDMTEAASRQAQALESGLHHTRKAVEETNEAMKVAAKAAQEARDSALVYEKLKESQPDFAAQVRGLEVRLAAVVDANTHLGERLNGLVKQLEEFEIVADAFEETQGEVRGLDLNLKRLDAQVRTNKPI